MNSDENTTTPSHAVQCFRALAAAATDPNLCGSDVACLAVILERFNRAKGSAWPSVNGIARDAHIHRNNVIRAIPRLEAAGYLIVDRRGAGRSNHYRPTFKTGTASGASTACGTGTANGAQLVPPMVLELVPPAVPEPIYRTYPKNLSINSREKSRSDRFDEFHALYPRKEGSKEKARKSWIRQNLDAKYDLVAADVAARIQSDPQWRTRKYIPHPLSYLNQQRWEDEWEPVPHKPSATDNFAGKVYTGTPVDQLPPDFREAVKKAMALEVNDDH